MTEIPTSIQLNQIYLSPDNLYYRIVVIDEISGLIGLKKITVGWDVDMTWYISHENIKRFKFVDV